MIACMDIDLINWGNKLEAENINRKTKEKLSTYALLHLHIALLIFFLVIASTNEYQASGRFHLTYRAFRQ